MDVTEVHKVERKQNTPLIKGCKMLLRGGDQCTVITTQLVILQTATVYVPSRLRHNEKSTYTSRGVLLPCTSIDT